MICYIAGPMTGLPDYNRKAFEEAEKQLREKGHKVISPAWLKNDLPKYCYLPICMAMIDQAEAVVLLPGWEDSLGVQVEKGYAEYCGKKTYMIELVKKTPKKEWKKDGSCYAENVKRMMREKSVSQQEVANNIGITRQTLSLQLNNKSRPTLEAAQNIADYFGISLDELVGRVKK